LAVGWSQKIYLFPLRRGKIEMGVQVKLNSTPTFVLPRRGGGNRKSNQSIKSNQDASDKLVKISEELIWKFVMASSAQIRTW
jgi:hypothetical protein